MNSELRKTLHASAELSAGEEKTAQIIKEHLEKFRPDRLIDCIGGHGLAAEFKGREPGPRVMLRCELDALPIPETISAPHGSKTRGVSHKCGHDGHMAIMVGVAAALAQKPPARGSVVLMFQPAEETGMGASMVIADKKFLEIYPDRVFGLHNLPGFPLGQIVLRKGVFAAASVGLKVRMTGATSHAAEPHQGRSPAQAVAQAIQSLSAVPQFSTALHEASKVTVIHARLGEAAFGTSPGEAEVMATLRAHEGEVLNRIKEKCLSVVKSVANGAELAMEYSWVEEFPSTTNDDETVDVLSDVANHLGMKIERQKDPFPWSEDFGNYTQQIPGAFWGLGAGSKHPALHHPDYDFPDELIEHGTIFYLELLNRTVGLVE